MFLAWHWLMKRVAFAPAEVMLLVGANGCFAEFFTFGGPNPIWFFSFMG